MRDLVDHRRASRVDGKLLIDWQAEQMVADGCDGKLGRSSAPFDVQAV